MDANVFIQDHAWDYYFIYEDVPVKTSLSHFSISILPFKRNNTISVEVFPRSCASSHHHFFRNLPNAFLKPPRPPAILELPSCPSYSSQQGPVDRVMGPWAGSLDLGTHRNYPRPYWTHTFDLYLSTNTRDKVSVLLLEEVPILVPPFHHTVKWYVVQSVVNALTILSRLNSSKR
jgi:hypothetical protein